MMSHDLKMSLAFTFEIRKFNMRQQVIPLQDENELIISDIEQEIECIRCCCCRDIIL